ncbi:hypothetical protein CsSME_00002083 [Camellia sinensis var. sinensis]
MENSNTMTIDFLWARLLAERSVSSTARQRADELAKRRKKAEKTIAYAHVILENHGMSGFSDKFDSSSDHKVIHCESKVSNNSAEEEEEEEEEGSLVGSKMRRNHTNEFSGSEPESSPLPRRSLSWKSGKDSSCSREKKYTDSSTRSRSTFASTTSASPRRRDGKCCRHIRRREARSAVEESQIDNSMLSPQESEIATCFDIKPEILRKSSEKQDAKVNLEGSVAGDLENQKSVASASNYMGEHGSDKDMERALEHQAQLIGQYEEEEKAQREWEEKFRENNNSTPNESREKKRERVRKRERISDTSKLSIRYFKINKKLIKKYPILLRSIRYVSASIRGDFCEPGNHSDITEERDETNAHTPPYPVGTIASEDQEPKAEVEEVRNGKESSKIQFDDVQYKKSSSMLAHESPASDFVFPVAIAKQEQRQSGNYSVPPSHSYQHLESPTGDQSARNIPSHTSNNFSIGDTSGSKNEPYALMPRETPNKLESVLGSLHQAKLSLKNKLNALPPKDSGSIGKAIQPSVGDRPEVPIGYAGLFRVPSDFNIEATTRANIAASSPRLSLTNYYPDAGSALTAVDHFVTSPSTESRPSVSNDDRHLSIPTSLSMENRSRIPSWAPLETQSRFSSRQPFFVPPSLVTGLTHSNGYINTPNIDTSLAVSNTYATRNYPFYPNLVPQMPSNEGPWLFSSSSGAGSSPANPSFHDAPRRPNMYR